ncbi:MAG: hypothetical protein RLZZ01_873 [Actinomycetota bacterium]
MFQVCRDPHPMIDTGTASLTRRDVALLALLIAVVRFAYAADRTTVSLSPDEYSSLAIARFLTGGEFNMLVASTYRSAPGLLLVPWTWLFDDPATIVRLGLAVNSVIAGATMFLLVPLVARFTSFGRTGVLLLSGIIALLPQSLEASSHLWAEPLVTLTFLGVVGSVCRFLDAPAARPGLAAIGWSTIGIASHGRLLPLAVLTVVFLVVAPALCRRWRLAAVHLGVGVLGLGGATLLQRWIVSEVWELPGSRNSAGAVFRRLGAPLEVLDAAAGQVWYQLAASGLLVAFGIFELLRRAFGRAGERNQRDARVLLVATVPLMGVSFTFMSDVARADHVLYGRYIDAVVWPVLAVGAHWLFHVRPVMAVRRRRFLIGAAIVVFVELSLVVHQLHRHQIRIVGVNAMIAGIVPFTDRGSVNALLVTGLALLVTGLLFVVARSPVSGRQLWSVVLVAVVATAGVRLWAIQRPDAKRAAPGVEAREILDLADRPPLGSEIGVSLMPNDFGPDIPRVTQLFAAYSYQLYLPEYRFVFDNGPFDEVGPYVFAVDNDALLTREGGTIVWEHPRVAMALWKEPTDPAG